MPLVVLARVQSGLRKVRWLAADSAHNKHPHSTTKGMEIHQRAYARVGLAGNPSDGYGGKCLSFCISNYHASVHLSQRTDSGIKFIPNAALDLCSFPDGLQGLHDRVSQDGYDGAIVLLVATCKRFVQACQELGHVLPSRGFDVRYDTTIPRQRGLAGSSALCTAMIKALVQLYGVDIPLESLVRHVWSAEKFELKINAGLQDRVVQVYEGLVAMDFDTAKYEEGYGQYRRLPLDVLVEARFLLVSHALTRAKKSGVVFSDVSARFARHDPLVLRGMHELADLAVVAEKALAMRDWGLLAKAMNRNFDVRCELFGDAVSPLDRAVVNNARARGAAAKLPGSGGAVLLFCPSDAVLDDVVAFFTNSGCDVCQVVL
jgi:glucuronokinase